MADATFSAKLVDGISGPAKKAADSLDRLFGLSEKVAKGKGWNLNNRDEMGRFLPGGGAFQKDLSLFERMAKLSINSMKGVDGGFSGKVLGAGLAHLADKAPGVKALTDSLSKLGLGFEDVGGLASVAGGAILSGFAMATTAAAAATVVAVGAIIGAIASASVAFTSFAAKVGGFRQNTMITMEVLLKDAAMAKKVYAEAIEFASVTPFETQDTVDMFKRLVTAGFKPDELKRAATAVGDAAASTGDKMAIQSITRAMSQIRSKGRLQGEELLQLTETGAVGQKDIFANIAEAMKVKPEQVQKLMEAGKISSDVAIEATIKAIEQTRGGTMAKLSATLEGQLSTLKSRPFELFNAAFNDENGGLSKYFKSLTGIVEFLQKAFDPKGATGQKIVGFIQQFASGLDVVAKLVLEFAKGFAKGFDDGKAKDAANSMNSLATIDIARIGKDMADLGQGLGAVTGGFSKLGPALEAAGKKFDELDAKYGFLKEGLKAIGYAAGAIVIIFAGLIAALGVLAAIGLGAWYFQFIWLPQKIQEAVASIEAQISAWYNAGVNVVLGFINGMTSMIAQAVAVAKSMASSVAAAVVSELKIGSPSKLMESYGSFTAQGFAGGLEGGTSEVSTSALAMSASAIQGTATGARAVSGGGGSGITIQSMVINAASGAHDDVKNAVLEAFEQIAIEMGGGVA